MRALCAQKETSPEFCTAGYSINLSAHFISSVNQSNLKKKHNQRCLLRQIYSQKAPDYSEKKALPGSGCDSELWKMIIRALTYSSLPILVGQVL